MFGFDSADGWCLFVMLDFVVFCGVLLLSVWIVYFWLIRAWCLVFMMWLCMWFMLICVFVGGFGLLGVYCWFGWLAGVRMRGFKSLILVRYFGLNVVMFAVRLLRWLGGIVLMFFVLVVLNLIRFGGCF